MGVFKRVCPARVCVFMRVSSTYVCVCVFSCVYVWHVCVFMRVCPARVYVCMGVFVFMHVCPARVCLHACIFCHASHYSRSITPQMAHT